MRLFGTMTVSEGELSIGGVKASALASEYGTPLYVMDERLIRETTEQFCDSFRHHALKTGILYAAKAFFNIQMARLADDMGLCLDVVSGGELYTASEAGFPMSRVYFHGNNKSEAELHQALEAGVGTIVLDNRSEALRLAAMLRGQSRRQQVLLRINPGISAHTHRYIQTASPDSKFGESLHDPDIFTVIGTIAALPELELAGLHCHIGSQIFAETTYFKAAETMLEFVRQVAMRCNVSVRTVNLGGGFGVYYTAGDQPLRLSLFLGRLLEHIDSARRDRDLPDLEILIEPGRSIIGNAGTTLYTIGDTKQAGGEHYLFVDGGMSDNLRPALYQAEYEAAVANRMDEPAVQTYTVAGKLCESGDVLIRHIDLPHAERGDLLAVASTGAYGYSMASNYNRNVIPAVVFVGNGKSRLAVRRQTYEDLTAQDIR